MGFAENMRPYPANAVDMDFVQATVQDYFARKREGILHYAPELPDGVMAQCLPRIEAIFTQALETAIYGPQAKRELPGTMIDLFTRIDHAGSSIRQQMQALRVEGTSPQALCEVMGALYTSLIAGDVNSRIMAWGEQSLQLPAAGFHSAQR